MNESVAFGEKRTGGRNFQNKLGAERLSAKAGKKIVMRDRPPCRSSKGSKKEKIKNNES